MSVCAIIDHNRQKPVTIEESDDISSTIYSLLCSGVTHFCGCGNGTVVKKCLRLLRSIKKRGYTKLNIKHCELSQKEIEIYMKNTLRYPGYPSSQEILEFTEKIWVNIADYIIIGKNYGYKIIDSDLKKLLKSNEKLIFDIPNYKF